MKKIALAVISFFSLAATAQGKSYTDYAHLSLLVDQLSAAVDGDSLENFEYVESVPEVRVSCLPKPIASVVVADQFIELAERILGVGEQAPLLALAKMDLIDVLGSGPYKSCSRLATIKGSWVSVQAYIGMDYTFYTETARED